MLLAQISDMHVVAPGYLFQGCVDTGACLERAVSHLNRLLPRPDLVLATGDLVNDGSLGAYQMLRRLLDRLEIPYALLPGNHDDRDHLRSIFEDRPGIQDSGEFLQYVLDELPVRIIALDTLVPGDDRGLLCPERLAWLAARLEEGPVRPTLIAMHHPPFASGIDVMDSMNCSNSIELGTIVARHPQVERIVCGHLHRPITLRWSGTVVTTAPSTAQQFDLNLLPAAPVKWILEPAACLLHYWRADSGLVTHMSYIDDYGVPQGFH
jgi:3',5'-cyclic-AMP phosphodiesterase